MGGNSTEASIIRYSTLSGLLYNIHVHRRTAPVRVVDINQENKKRANDKADRHAPVFILKHIQEDLFALRLIIFFKKKKNNKESYSWTVQ